MHQDFRPDGHRYTPDHTDSQRGAQQATCRQSSDFPKEHRELNIRGFVLVQGESVCVCRARMAGFAAKVSRSVVQLNMETALGMGDLDFRVVS